MFCPQKHFYPFNYKIVWQRAIAPQFYSLNKLQRKTMNRHKYKNYWIEISLECRGDEGNELYCYCPSIEYPNEAGTADLEDYVTYEEAKIGAERYIDMLEAFPESEVNFIVDEAEEFVFNQPEAWGSSIL